jgi:hypothetical protein
MEWGFYMLQLRLIPKTANSNSVLGTGVLTEELSFWVDWKLAFSESQGDTGMTLTPWQ